jgi:hypothetical protein
MATAESVKDKIQGLISQANGVTGKTDADLTTAIGSLIAGFGQGGGSGGGATLLESGEVTLASEINPIYVQLTQPADMAVFYVADPSEITEVSTVGTIVSDIPALAAFLPYRSAELTNVDVSIRFLNGAYTLQGSGASRLSSIVEHTAGNEISLKVGRISASYPFRATTYKWAAYKLWGGEST